MFDKLFLLDERVLLHRWDVLFAQLRIVARAAQAAGTGAWTAERYRDVLALTADGLLTVERDLNRFGLSPARVLKPADTALWQAASAWVSALREWSLPPAELNTERVEGALTGRRALEAAVRDVIFSIPPAVMNNESADRVEPIAVR